MKLDVSPDLVERAARIMGAEDVSDENLESQVLALTRDQLLSRRLIDILPEAFSLVLAPHIAAVVLPTTFSAQTKRGEWIEIELRSEPIFKIAVELGTRMYHDNSSDIFKNVAMRSAIVDAINRALNNGDSLEGAQLSGPALLGVPAETYLPSRPLWRRLLR